MLMMTLCREVYHCGLTELPGRISLDELRLWRQFYAREGTWDDRADIRSAIIGHTVACQKGYEARIIKGERVTLADFMFTPVKTQSAPKTPEQLHAKLTALAAALTKRR